MKHIKNYQLCLFDIEGTTTPISFVHEILFPYSAKRIRNFIFANPLPKQVIIDLYEENKADTANGNFKESIVSKDLFLNREILVRYLLYLISVDRKSKPLKEIQGKIWKQGYESGEITSLMYEDVPVFFTYLKKYDIQIAIYSSGSIEAQKLIFQYSNAGDLTKFISGYFDTNVGGKRESASYQNISTALKLAPAKILFFTDIKEEADAAIEAGMDSILLDRPGNKPQDSGNLTAVKDFTSFIND